MPAPASKATCVADFPWIQPFLPRSAILTGAPHYMATFRLCFVPLRPPAGPHGLSSFNLNAGCRAVTNLSSLSDQAVRALVHRRGA